MLQFGYEKVPVYCYMDGNGLGECGGGGWTLVMKIDGAQVQFNAYVVNRFMFCGKEGN